MGRRRHHRSPELQWRCLRRLSSKKFAGSRLLRRDDDLDCGVWPEMVAVLSMMFRVPMPNPSPDLTDKVKAALLSQVSEIADQVCDGMIVTGAAVPRKIRDSLGSPSNVVGFIGHARPSTWLLKGDGLLPSR